MAQQWRIRLQCRSHRRRRFHPWVRKIPWRRKWQPTPRFLPGESHGQRSLVDYSPVGSQRVWQDWAAKHICSYHRWRVQAHLNWGFLPKSSPSLFFFFFLKPFSTLKVLAGLRFFWNSESSRSSHWLLAEFNYLWLENRASYFLAGCLATWGHHGSLSSDPLLFRQGRQERGSHSGLLKEVLRYKHGSDVQSPFPYSVG